MERPPMPIIKQVYAFLPPKELYVNVRRVTTGEERLVNSLLADLTER